MTILFVIIVMIALYFFYFNPEKSVLPTPTMSCSELINLFDVEENKLDFSCEKDTDCTLIPVGCGICVNGNTNTKNYEEIYGMLMSKGCVPIVDCLRVECKCLNNKCESKSIE